MGRTGRLRNAVEGFLRKKLEANTAEIHEYINNRYKWGCSMNTLTNILAKDPRFVKIGHVKSQQLGGGRYRLCSWSLTEFKREKVAGSA